MTVACHFQSSLGEEIARTASGSQPEPGLLVRALTANPADDVNAHEDRPGQREDHGNGGGSIGPLIEGSYRGRDLFSLRRLSIHAA